MGIAPPTALSKLVKPAWAGVRKHRPGEAAIKFLCLICALVSIATTLGIVVVLAKETFIFFQRVSPVEYFTGTRWAPTIAPESYGVLPLFAGTLLVTLGAGLIALPLGLLAAIYLSEYAPIGVKRLLKPALEVLAGIPTVVYGYFGLFVVTPMLRDLFPSVEVFNAASGFIVVGIMILPLVSSLCEDALSAVPMALREGAYGLGSTKLEVTTRIVVPGALSGIMASFILALSRAVGETMAVTLACGSTPNLTFNPAEGIQTMTAFIVQISKGDTPSGTTPYYTLFAVGMTLFVMTLLMNMLSQWLVSRFRLAYQ